jgi:MFS family permease
MTEDGIPPTPPAKPADRPTTDAPTAPAFPRGSALRSGLFPGATAALALLLFINMFNYIDRQVLAAVEPAIEKTFYPAGGEAVEFGIAMPVEFWMGLLSTAFMVAYMLLAPIFGVLADRMSRWKIMGFGVAVWSLASGASGLAMGFAAMLLTRGVVGVGEAAYGPAAPAVLSDLYPAERRGAILSYFYVAVPVGSALGYVLGAVMSLMTHDWRWAFFVVVPPGLLLALLCLFMREPPRGQSDLTATTRSGPGAGPGAGPRSARWADYVIILKTPSFLLCVLGYTATTFSVGGMAYWVPRYVAVNRNEALPALDATTVGLLASPGGQGPLLAAAVAPVRVHSLETELFTVNMVFGGVTVVAGLFSTLLGGWAGDALRRRFPGSYFLVSAAGMFVAFPLLLAVLVTPFPWAYVLIFLTVFGLFFNTGPVNTIVANVTHPAVRASAFALEILIIHLFGDAFAPPIIGYITGWARQSAQAGQRSWWTDFLGRHGGMDFSFFVVSLLILLAGVIWLWGARYLERDTALAPTRGAPPERETP